MNDVSVDVGQTHVTTTMAVDELFMIQTQLVQDRGVQIVHGHDVFDGMHAELIVTPWIVPPLMLPPASQTVNPET